MTLKIIIFSILVLLVYIPIIVTYFKSRINSNAVDRTFYNCASLGYLISIDAPIRKGKSSLGNGLIHNLEILKQNQCFQELNEIISKLYFINFAAVNDFIYPLLVSKYSVKDVLDLLVEKFQVRNGVVNNWINNITVYQLLARYIDDFRILNIRRRYVVSKTYLYSYVTNTNAKLLYDETMQIKKVQTHKTFYLERYMILFNDELNLNNSNKLSNSKEVFEQGRKEFRTLFGQMFEETSHFIQCKQVSMDEIASERRLLQSNLYIRDKRFVNKYAKIGKLILKIKAFIVCLYKIKFAFKKLFLKRFWGLTYEDYLISSIKDRRKLSLYDSMSDLLKAQQNLKFFIHDYNNSENVGKVDDKYYEAYSLIFPIKFTFGVNKTHEYSFLRERLQNESIITLDDVPEVSYFNKKEQVEKQISFAFKESAEEVGGAGEDF